VSPSLASFPLSPSIPQKRGSATAGPAYLQPAAASAMTISGADINARPFSRPGEALEAVPGLIVTQHSGEGKANQYFLRGFNLDHGTDLASASTECRSTCRPMAMGRAMPILIS
jgi:TonB-dependent receptor-like protein